MKIIFVCLILLFSISASAQKVLIQGIAKDTMTRRDFNSLTIIVNDTVNKLAFRNLKTMEALPKRIDSKQAKEQQEIVMAIMKSNTDLWNDTNYVVRPKMNGSFSIRADLKDTLYFTSGNFITQKYAVSDLAKRQSVFIQLEPLVCIQKEVCNEKNPKLYVLIAEKIAVKRVHPYYCNIISMDGQFEAKYKVIKSMYGDLQKDTIDFVAYDHYGTPGFSNHQYAMLFVVDACSNLLHLKYQYFDVYPTADGKWARPGDPYFFETQVTGKRQEAIAIKFKDSVFFDLASYDRRTSDILFKEPYFKIINEKVYPLKGAYAETLLEIKKEGVLKRLGYDLQ